jgi:uncharacterized protein
MDPQRPLPQPTALTAPYWEACRRGELVIQHCPECRRFVHFPKACCPFCGAADLPYEKVSGRGTVHTFSVIHRSFLPGFSTPYTIAWIDLEEGARVFGSVVGEVEIGTPVEVRFTDDPFPNWQPSRRQP